MIAIIGPTASGKTAFSIDLALKLKESGVTAEVVNADSRQFYRGLNIGTAKITEKEMEGVPHHLLSVLDPKDGCTISWFQKEATKVIEDIHARGNIPLLVGGSMLYVSAIVDGLEPLPSADPVVRKGLEAKYDADGGVALYERLLALDPDAVTFQRENKIYVIRALEIYEATGKTKSAQKKSSGSPYDTLILGIDRDQKELAERIEQRTRAMFEAGWIEEVQSLLEEGCNKDDPAMKSHGYREIIESLPSFFVRSDKERSKESAYAPTPTQLCISASRQTAHPQSASGGRTTPLEAAVQKLSEQISTKGRQYAKRHRTWWKDDERVHWVKPDVACPA